MTTLTNARLRGAIVDVRIDAGRITSIMPTGAASGDTIDLDGRWLLPGLWDHHVHLNQQALAMRRIDLAGAASAADAVAIVADRAGRVRREPGQLLLGHGFRDGLWPDVPTASLLDAAVGDVPTVLISGDLHCAWLNSSALAMFGLAAHDSGILREDDCFDVVGKLQDIPEDTLDRWVAEAAAAAAARGVVGVVDMEMADNFAAWSRRAAGGFDTLRVEAGVYTEFLDAAISAERRTGDWISADGLITVGPFKVLTDGSLNTRTAYCIDVYPGTHDHGLLTVPPDELVPLLGKASMAGFAPAVHAIGDEANRLALDAFETVGCGGRIEHAQLLRESDIARFAALSVSVSAQPEHAMDDRDVADHFWAGRTGRAFALRSLLDAGTALLLGSDAPVSPLDPWVSMSAAVSRARDGRAPWHPEQAITLEEALTASTHSIVVVGEVADLIAVENDPFTASGDELRTMPVALTLVAGRPTHRVF